ncbi:MAG TPA: TonB-dependent receptor [Povalibacter sp.]|nr:TonB-dependent receptor [Povalibacter sp.]
MNSRFKPGAAAVAAAACFTSFAGFAADTDTVGEVVVTAARLAQPISDVIGSATVITRAEIQRRQAQSIQDLLRGEAGISVANNGGLGKLSSMFIRGAEADQVLVLVDGVRVGSTSAGTTRIEFLPVDQIDRIEIVRGPRSSLYGADAIGGVIQIFTIKGQGPSVSVGGGSHDTYNAAASFGLNNDNAWFSVSGNYVESDGFNSCRASFAAGCFTDEPDADGYRNASGSLRAGYRWGEKADIEASALYASGHNEYDGGYTNETDFVESVFSVKGRFAPTANWNLTAQVGVSHDDADDFKDGAFRGTIDTERRNASVQSDWTLSRDQVVSLGVDYLEDRLDSTTAYDQTSRDNTGVFGQYKGRFGAHEILASVRNDDNEQFGSHTTGNLGWKWFFADGLALSAAWGSAFLAPNFNDLYYPGSSDPNLRPEESDSYEIGLSGSGTPVAWSLSAFQTQIDDLIVFAAVPGTLDFLPQNISEARIRGVEAEAHTRWNNWSFAANYTYLDPRNRGAGTNYDNYLPRRARQSGRLDVSYSTGAFSVGTIVNVQGSRYDNVANSAELGGYALVDFIGEYRFPGGWSVQGKIANAFDRDYETARFYYQDGRTYFVTLRYQPGL